MSYNEWNEKCQERLDADLLGYLLADTKSAMRDFLCWLEDDIKTGGACTNLSYSVEQWATKDNCGKAWHKATLKSIINDRPEREFEHE